MAGVHTRAEGLRAARTPYVHARVVLADRPTSAKPGDEALVLPDGSIEGFVGGSCAESTVRTHGLAVLERGETELLRIAPTPEPGQPGKVVVHNPCLSGGTLEIFLEPILPPPLVRVSGSSPIAQALATVGTALGYEVAAWDGTTEGVDAVVVAAHGLDDEQAVLAAALDAGVPYIALVASPKRGAAVLEAMGLPAEDRARVKTPAGLDIGARTPPEIAVSVFAELIQRRHARTVVPPSPTVSGGGFVPDEGRNPHHKRAAVDPVCGMAVSPVESTPSLEHAGVTYWFCCPGCRRAFSKAPGEYLPA